MQLGFVGFLDVDQVLILWDRLLGMAFMDSHAIDCVDSVLVKDIWTSPFWPVWRRLYLRTDHSQ